MSISNSEKAIIGDKVYSCMFDSTKNSVSGLIIADPLDREDYGVNYLKKRGSQKKVCEAVSNIMNSWLGELVEEFTIKIDAKALSIKNVLKKLPEKQKIVEQKIEEDDKEDFVPLNTHTKKEAIKFIENKIKRRKNSINFTYCAGALLATVVALPILASSIALFFVPVGTVVALGAFSLILTQTMIISLGIVGIIASLIVFVSINAINHGCHQTPRTITAHLEYELTEGKSKVFKTDLSNEKKRLRKTSLKKKCSYKKPSKLLKK